VTHPIITVRNLSKLYRIGARRDRYKTLRSSLNEAIAAPFRRLKGTREEQVRRDEAIWAVKDISFDVQQGQVVGLIGRNGAGKSTLLKILSEITYPTEGRVEIRGRVGSLLEIGTGFHPELTGRENIFLNGAILGMTRAEIKRKFDEIVAFAEVDKFIDTPVKRYSSGMYVRLAFAVAAHLEPEILLVDEVLAVGDAQFQKKCLGKMSDVAHGEGRTILFVSHNMAAIESLCDRCILLDGGRVVADGPVDTVIAAYQAAGAGASADWVDLSKHTGRRTGSVPLMKRAALLDESGAMTASIRMGSSLSVQVEFESLDKPLRPFLGLSIKTFIGARVTGIDNRIIPGFVFDPVGRGRITCRLDRVPLMPGNYVIDLYLGDENLSLDAVFDAITFEVAPADVFGSGKLPPPHCGPVCWPATWHLDPIG
jgi:lipopolysaccharide transport system ATP-binding protein